MGTGAKKGAITKHIHRVVDSLLELVTRPLDRLAAPGDPGPLAAEITALQVPGANVQREHVHGIGAPAARADGHQGSLAMCAAYCRGVITKPALGAALFTGNASRPRKSSIFLHIFIIRDAGVWSRFYQPNIVLYIT